MYFFFEPHELFLEKGMQGECGIRNEQVSRLGAGDFNQPEIRKILHGDIGESRLSCAEKSPGSAEREVGLGDLEPTRAFFERFETDILGGGFARNKETI